MPVSLRRFSGPAAVTAPACRKPRITALARRARRALSFVGLTVLLSLPPALAVAQTAEPLPPLPGVAPGLGKDGLAIIDSDAHPWASIGRVNRAGYRSTSMCTGTLIRPDVVLTAAHCLFDRVTGTPFRPEDVVFLAGVRREDYSARLQAACFRVDPDYDPKATPQLQTLYSDVALIILDRPSDLPLVDQVSPLDTALPERDATLVSVGYHKDRRFLPTADPACHVIGAVEGSWVTDCQTKQGASGGPVFLRDRDELKIAAIMSATAGEKASVVVPHTRWQPLLATASCDAFAPVPLSDTVPFEGVPGEGDHAPDPGAAPLRPALD